MVLVIISDHNLTELKIYVPQKSEDEQDSRIIQLVSS